MRAISAFTPEAGMCTSSWAAWIPLRIRVKKSAMGSVIDMRSPAALGHARDEALVGHIAQADAAQAELAVHGTRPAALAAARVAAHLVLRCAVGGNDLGGLGHSCPQAVTREPARREGSRRHRD